MPSYRKEMHINLTRSTSILLIHLPPNGPNGVHGVLRTVPCGARTYSACLAAQRERDPLITKSDAAKQEVCGLSRLVAAVDGEEEGMQCGSDSEKASLVE